MHALFGEIAGRFLHQIVEIAHDELGYFHLKRKERARKWYRELYPSQKAVFDEQANRIT